MPSATHRSVARPVARSGDDVHPRRHRERQHGASDHARPVPAGRSRELPREHSRSGDDSERLSDLRAAVAGDLGIPVGQEGHGIDDVAQLRLVVWPVLDAVVVILQLGCLLDPSALVDLPRMAQVDDRADADGGELIEVITG